MKRRLDMGYKNATHKYKRVISHNKLSRIFNSNLDLAGVATIYRNHNEGFVNSLKAIKIGDIIYAVFPCKHQSGNRLDTYAIRYHMDYPLDFVSFKEYPSHLISKAVEF
jgi:hypothetical protein